jgi:DNA-directed RNA polymerase specialized sigma24 family protein
VDDEAMVSDNAAVPAGQRGEEEPGQMSDVMAGRAEDAALVERALAGDQEAFAQLEARTDRALRSFFRTRVRRTDEVTGKYIPNTQAIDDLIQKTWIELWPQLASYDPARARFSTFATNWAGFIVRRYHASPEYQGRERPISRGRRDDADSDDDYNIDRLNARGEPVFPAPEDPVDADVYDNLVTLIFATASPPHQLLVMGFVKGLEWRPRQVAAELADSQLRALAARFEADYLEQSEIPSHRVSPAFAPLRENVERRFADAVHDPVTLKTYPALHDRVVGDTTLADYFTDDPAADITQWWYAVKRRVIAEILRRGTGPLADMLRETQRASKNKGAARRANG